MKIDAHLLGEHIVRNRIICREDRAGIADHVYKKDVAQFGAHGLRGPALARGAGTAWPSTCSVPTPRRRRGQRAQARRGERGSWSKRSVAKWKDERSLMRQEHDTILSQACPLRSALPAPALFAETAHSYSSARILVAGLDTCHLLAAL